MARYVIVALALIGLFAAFVAAQTTSGGPLPDCTGCTNPVTGTCPTFKIEKVSRGEECTVGACTIDGENVWKVCDNEDDVCACEPGQGGKTCCTCEGRNYKTIGQDCTGENDICRDGFWDVSCGVASDVCGNSLVLAPGDTCTTTDQARFDNTDGCAIGSCDSDTNTKCTFVATGDACTVDENCQPQNFCDTDATGGPVCAARQGAGTDCTRDRQCGYNHRCVFDEDASPPGSTCVRDFTVGVGGACSFTSCQEGLCCNSDANCAEPGPKIKECTSNDQCGDCGACVCDSKKGTRSCEYETIPQKLIDAYNAMVQCAQSNNCDDYTAGGLGGVVQYFPDGCMGRNCRSQTDEFLRLSEQDTGSSASTVAVVAAVLVAAVLAVL